MNSQVSGQCSNTIPINLHKH